MENTPSTHFLEITESTPSSVALSSVSDVSVSNSFEKDSFMEKKVLIGRNGELVRMLYNFYQVKLNQSFECMVVHGDSGTGKTSLVHEFQKEVIKKGGIFTWGKFSEHTEYSQEPYSAIMAAFSDLCDLMLQLNDFNEERQKKIQQALGSDGQLLVRSVTNITPFLDSAPSFDLDPCSETRFTKFKAACVTFLRAMSSRENPLVFFLDDIQWIDKGSEAILKTILQDSEMKNVIIILAYRNENVEYAKSILPSAYVDFSIQNLASKHVHELISSKLGSGATEIEELSKIIHRKTLGNPFHVLEFLSTMEREGLLTFDAYASSWDFDIVRIESGMKMSDSVVELLSRRITNLDINVRKMLQLCSLVGFQFSEEMVMNVMIEFFRSWNNSVSNAATRTSEEINLKMLLKRAVKENYLEKTRDGYKFNHDKLQAVFCSSLKASEKGEIHLIVGKSFLRQSSDTSAYHAAVHLNQTSLYHEEAENANNLARINFKASKYCESKSAFSESISFLKHGLSRINESEKWSEHFYLAFEMTSALARMEYVMGNYKASLIANQEVLRRAKSNEMKIAPLLHEIDVLISDFRFDDVITHGTVALKELGIAIPKKITPYHIFRKLRKVRKDYNLMSDEEILQPADKHNFHLSATVKILVRIFAAFMFSGNVRSGIYFILSAAELTLTRGLTSFGAGTIAMCGGIEIRLGSVDKAVRLGKLALRALTIVPSNQLGSVICARCLFTIIYHKERLRNYVDVTRGALKNSFEIADSISIRCAGISSCFFLQFFTGESLPSLEKSIRSWNRRLVALAYHELPTAAKPLLQFVMNLQSAGKEWCDLSRFTGDVMNEEEYRAKISPRDEGANPYFWFILNICKMLQMYTFGFYEDAYRIYDQELVNSKPFSDIGYLYLQCQFFHALSSFRLYLSTRHQHHSAQSKKYLRAARRIKKIISKQHNLGNPNATPLLKILQVESLALRSKSSDEIAQVSEEAIQLQRKEGLVHLEVIANEQASRLLEGFGGNASTSYLDAAKKACKNQWGAMAKYELLRARGTI